MNEPTPAMTRTKLVRIAGLLAALEYGIQQVRPEVLCRLHSCGLAEDQPTPRFAQRTEVAAVMLQHIAAEVRALMDGQPSPPAPAPVADLASELFARFLDAYDAWAESDDGLGGERFDNMLYARQDMEPPTP